MSRSPRAILVACAFLPLASGAPAQLIAIKTVPVAQADQFDLFPSRNLAMGGVSIAVQDPWLDPFINPAKGARLSGGLVAGAPGMFSISDNAGGGRTLPVSVMGSRGSWFGGLSLAIQEIDGARDVTPIQVFDGDPVGLSSVATRAPAACPPLALQPLRVWHARHPTRQRAIAGREPPLGRAERHRRRRAALRAQLRRIAIRPRRRRARRPAQGLGERAVARSDAAAQPDRHGARRHLPRLVLGSGPAAKRPARAGRAQR